jgi:MFS family permease
MSDQESQQKQSAPYAEAAIDTPRSVAEVLDSRPNLPWFKNKQLLKLYLVLIPSCLFVSATNGFDGSMLNGLQSLKTWQSDFNHPTGPILGIISAAYALGAVLSTPLSPIISDRFGRRWSIVIGSMIMLLGVGLQAGSHTSMHCPLPLISLSRFLKYSI